INALLLFGLTFRIAKTTRRSDTEAFWVSLVTGCLFAVHPLLTESVTYIAGRSSSLCATLYFVGLFAMIEAGVRKRRHWIPVGITLLCFIIGMLIKQEAVMLPPAAIALVWLVWPAQRDRRLQVAVTAVLLGTLVVTVGMFRSSIQAVADTA